MKSKIMFAIAKIIFFSGILLDVAALIMVHTKYHDAGVTVYFSGVILILIAMFIHVLHNLLNK
jgi:uncharacterized membrane protein